MKVIRLLVWIKKDSGGNYHRQDTHTHARTHTYSLQERCWLSPLLSSTLIHQIRFSLLLGSDTVCFSTDFFPVGFLLSFCQGEAPGENQEWRKRGSSFSSSLVLILALIAAPKVADIPSGCIWRLPPQHLLSWGFSNVILYLCLVRAMVEIGSWMAILWVPCSLALHESLP